LGRYEPLLLLLLLSNSSQSHPEKLKWRHEAFPWYEKVAEICGDALPAGKHAFFGGIDDDEPQSDGDIDNLGDQEEDLTIRIDPRLSQQQQSRQPSSTPALRTPSGSTTRSSSAANNREDTAPPSKKRKSTGVGVMEGLVESVREVAQAMGRRKVIATAPEDVSATIVGQALQKIMLELCLTNEGKLAMADIIEAEPAKATSYLLFNSEQLRETYLERLLLKRIEARGEGSIDQYFISSADQEADWEC
jgi:hypothetical protein